MKALEIANMILKGKDSSTVDDKDVDLVLKHLNRMQQDLSKAVEQLESRK